MVETIPRPGRTRMIFMGEAPLADGFRLIGFETWPDPSVDQVERLVRELSAQRENAFLVIDQSLAAANLPSIQRIRKEGGHIVISAVPPLNNPDAFRPLIDDRLRTLFAGAGGAEERP